MSPSTEPEAVGRNILIVSTTLTGLMVLEYAWNINFEMRVIWPQFWMSAEAKIFVIARYVSLAGQIVIIFSFWFATGRLVLDKERFLQESRNDFQLTEVDLNNLEPLEDSDVSFARPSDSNVLPTEATIAVDSELSIGTEEDLADGCDCDWVDDASLSRCAFTIMSMEVGNDGESSGSRN
ncbi:hypothetical protein AZE42_12462 [Rhizopogon vesiculosus]|uniref:Uncharacterized protein n=1 Tax=Rhizopogon vesiculosus TaxID=180088 RepID=A0A1J8QFP0_9AGAM|nr:hypothetical protein AZE42_12462 [Rhizopogon vesiculosus]